MKIVIASDVHERHREVVWPDGDLLIIVGDLTDAFAVRNYRMTHQMTVLRDADEFLGQKYPKILVVPGNHDYGLENPENRYIFKHMTILVNQTVDYKGVIICGIPVTSTGMAFWKEDGKADLELIPSSIDILATHSPPAGMFNTRWGRKDILELSQKVKPKVHVFGHDHDKLGDTVIGTTRYINVSLYDKQMRAPFIISLPQT